MPPTLEYVKPVAKQALEGEDSAIFCEALSELQLESLKAQITTLDAGDVVVLDDFLTKEECSALTRLVESHPALSFWSQAGRDDDKARSFRDADTIEVMSEDIASKLWNRMKGCGFDDITISIEDESDGSNDSLWERELAGSEWRPVNFNHDLLFVKYPSGGAFAPHTDGHAIHDFNRRSFYSVILFLNDIPDGRGGGTRFYKREALQNLQNGKEGRWTAADEYKTHEVSPQAGRLLIFDQRLVHEGVPPTDPYVKHIIRSDVMYQRTEPVCNSTEDKEAYRMFREAEVVAETGDVEGSVKLFRRALKMSPTLAMYMGQ